MVQLTLNFAEDGDYLIRIRNNDLAKFENKEKEVKDLEDMLSECRKSLGICMNRLQENKLNKDEGDFWGRHFPEKPKKPVD